MAKRDMCDPQAASDLLRALAHPMRLRILCRLLEGELAVAGFETEIGLKQPSLSQQLAQLREAGLVATRREAKSVFYRLTDGRVQIMIAALHEAFGGKPHPAGSQPAAARAKRANVSRVQARHRPAPHAASGSPSECGVFPTVGADAAQARQP